MLEDARAARSQTAILSDTDAEALIFGAGGAATAITWHWMRADAPADRPARLIITDRSDARLAEIAAFHRTLGSSLPVTYVPVTDLTTSDQLLAALPNGSLVINATGLGKDAPGSPLSPAAQFPDQAIAFDLNYRGNLVFLDQARAASDRGVMAADGWVYFLHGWTRVIAEVFAIDIPVSGPGFDALSTIARSAGRG